MNDLDKIKELETTLGTLTPWHWNGGEIVVVTAEGERTLAQIAIKPLKSANGDWIKVKRVSCKPNTLLPITDLRKRAAFITVKDFSNWDHGDTEIKIQAYIAAIYTALMPYLVAKKSHWAEANHRKEFFEILQSLLELPTQDLEAISRILDPNQLIYNWRNYQHLATIIQASLALASGDSIKNIDLRDLRSLLKVTGGNLSARGRIANLVKEGATRGAVGQLSRKTLRTITESLGDNAPAWIHGQLAQRALEGLSPALILLILDFDTSNRISPKIKEKITVLAEKALESFADHAAGDVMDEIFAVLSPVLNDWIAAASAMTDSEEPEVITEEGTKTSALAEALSANQSRSPRSM